MTTVYIEEVIQRLDLPKPDATIEELCKIYKKMDQIRDIMYAAEIKDTWEHECDMRGLAYEIAEKYLKEKTKKELGE
jgi:hypothetical protein